MTSNIKNPLVSNSRFDSFTSPVGPIMEFQIMHPHCSVSIAGYAVNIQPIKGQWCATAGMFACDGVT